MFGRVKFMVGDTSPIQDCANAARFIGWFRQKRWHVWRAAVEAADEEAAWKLLLDKTQGGEKCVLPGNVDPNHKPAPNTARRLLP
jgi:hypothetical protein